MRESRGIRALAVAMAVAASALVGIPAAATAEQPKPLRSDTAGIRGATDDTVPVAASVLAKAATMRVARARSLADVTTRPQVHTIWIDVVSATASTGDDQNLVPETVEAAQNVVAAMNAYWTQESGGAISLVFGGFHNTDVVSSCSLDSIYDQSAASAFDGTFANSSWAGHFRHLLTFSRESCNGGGAIGLGSVGGDGGIIATTVGDGGDFGFSTENHEFGHNLGFEHSSTSLCANPSFDAAQASYDANADECELNPYDDTLDLMSSATVNARTHLSSVQRIRMGWLTDYATATGAGSSTSYTINPLGASGASGIRAVTIVDPFTGDVYYVEYRTADAADSASYEFTQPSSCLTSTIDSRYSDCAWGVPSSTGSLRVLRGVDDSAHGLDMTALAVGATTPATAFQRLTHLDAGTSFTNYDGAFTLTVHALSPTSGATISVAFSATGLVRTTTTALALTPSGVIPGGSTVTAHVTLTGTAPVGRLVVRDGPTQVASADVSSAGSVDLPLGEVLAGAHTYTATFVPSTSRSLGSQSATVPLSVDRIATTTTLTRSGSTLTARTTVSHGSTNPAGYVSFAKDGTRFARVLVSGGVAAAPLPKLAAGKHAITASFAPTDTTIMTGSTAAKTIAGLVAAKVKATISPKVRTTKKAVVHVTVTTKATRRPTGKLVVTLNGTAVTSTTLTAAMKGKATITLPRVHSTGTKKLRVRYTGSATVGSAASPVTRFRVVR